MTLSKFITYFLTSLSLGLMILALISPVQVWAAVSDYRYRAPVALNATAADYNFLELTDEVLGQSEPG